MAWWNAQYKNEHGEYAVQFGSKIYEEAKAVEEVCKMVLDGMVKSPDDIDIVIRGRWEDRGGQLMPMHRYDEFTNPDSIFNGTCSVCGITVYQGGILNGFNYCPHCGAKMDEKENEK